MHTLHKTLSILVGMLLLVSAVFGVPQPARAATLCVEPSGAGGCYTTIQAAIDAASDGDTIEVAAGTYDGTINIVGRSNLTIVGEDKSTTIIKSSTVIGWELGYGTTRNTVIRVEGSTGIVFQNFTVDLDLVHGNNVSAYFGWNSTGEIHNNLFQNSSRPDDEGYYYELGVYLRAPGYSDVSRANFSITNNTFYNMGRVAIVTHDFMNTTISGNTIYKDMDDFGYGIEMGSTSTGTISNNVIYGYDTAAASDGSTSGGIYIENCFTGGLGPVTKSVTVSGNEIYDSQYALHIGNEFNGYAGNVDIILTVTGNNFHDNIDGAVIIADEDKSAGSSVTATFTGNTIANNGETGFFLYTLGDGDLTVDIQGGSITGHDFGVYLNDWGTPPSSSTYNIKIENVNISGNTVAIQNDYDGTSIAAEGNWYGSAANPSASISGDVDFNPWCGEETCAHLVYGVSAGGSIQDAIDSAAPCDTVYLDAGTYDVAATITIDKCLTLTGPTTGTAKVVGTAADMFKVFTITSGNVILEKLEITLAVTPAYPLLVGDELNSSLIGITGGTGMTGIIIRNNVIYVPAQTPPMGNWTARAITASSNTVSGMSITGNTIYNTRNGVVIHYNNSVNISDNTIYNTKGGIMNYTSDQADADNRVMSNNSWSTVHNEWDIVWNSGAYYTPDYNSVLVLSGANNGAYVLDRRAGDADAVANLVHNRSHIFVNTVSGTLVKHPANGNMNLPYGTLALGYEAVVPGGTVYVYPPSVPPLPSNFYGYIHISDGAPSEGDKVDAYLPGVAGIAAQATIITDPETSTLAYQIDIPGDLDGGPVKEGGAEGDIITFKIGTRVVATAVWHSGTNVRLDFHPPEALPGGPYNGLVGASISFSASANDWGDDVTTYQWDWDNDGTFDETGQTPTHAWPDTGTYQVSVRVIDSNGGQGTDTVEVHIASITLSNLTQVYTATPRVPTAVTDPSGLTVDLTYDGSPTPPTNVGTYIVVATIAGYTGSVTDTLTITPAALSITATDRSKTYGDTVTFAGTEFTTSGLLGSDTVTSVTLVSAGAASSAPVGDYPIVPSAAVGSGVGNYDITYTNGNLHVAAAAAAISLSDLAPVYDGTPKSPTVTTDPAGLSYSITYNGLPDAPTAPGAYAIVATITDPNYSGTATGTMYILATHSLTLVPGWNLVSFNLVPMDTDIAVVLASISGQYDLVYAWDATGGHAGSGNWLKYAPVMPYGNTLTNLDETMGFWIHVTAASNITLNVNGNAPTTTSIALSTNAGGWNLVGYPSHLDADLPGALASLGTDYTLVYSYRAVDTADPWKLFDRTAPGFASDLKKLEPGWGYWIKVSANHTWDVAY